MNSLAKRLLRVTSFFAILALLLYGSSQLLQPKGNAREDGMHDATANGILSEPPDTLDVLFLGDSESYSSFIPLKIWQDRGITSYVCGTPGQKLFYTMEFLKKAFQAQNPKVVVLETNAIFRKYSPLDATSNRLQNLFSVFRYHNRWKTLKPKDLKLSVNYNFVENAKGYVYNTAVSPADTKGYMAPSVLKEQIPSGNVEQIKAMEAYCRERGARMILVSVPSTINWNQKRHNAVEELAQELDVTYVDLNLLTEAVPIDWNRDTSDKGDHLNFRGAEKVSAYLSGYLAEYGGFADKRAEPAYQFWNEALTQFNHKTNNALGTPPASTPSRGPELPAAS